MKKEEKTSSAPSALESQQQIHNRRLICRLHTLSCNVSRKGREASAPPAQLLGYFSRKGRKGAKDAKGREGKKRVL